MGEDLRVREFTCCFTGHRDIPREDYQEVKHRTEKAVESLIKKGVKYFGAGGALGFDWLPRWCLKRKRFIPKLNWYSYCRAWIKIGFGVTRTNGYMLTSKCKRTRSFTLQRNTQKGVCINGTDTSLTTAPIAFAISQKKKAAPTIRLITQKVPTSQSLMLPKGYKTMRWITAFFYSSVSSPRLNKSRSDSTGVSISLSFA